jgi:hypothetical protein
LGYQIKRKLNGAVIAAINKAHILEDFYYKQNLYVFNSELAHGGTDYQTIISTL